MKNATIKAEELMWSYLQNKRLGGYAFYRMRITEGLPGTLFCCPDAGVLIKIKDAGSLTQKLWERELEIALDLMDQGLAVLSFDPMHVVHRVDFVLSTILSTLQDRTASGQHSLFNYN